MIHICWRRCLYFYINLKYFMLGLLHNESILLSLVLGLYNHHNACFLGYFDHKIPDFAEATWFFHPMNILAIWGQTCLIYVCIRLTSSAINEILSIIMLCICTTHLHWYFKIIHSRWVFSQPPFPNKTSIQNGTQQSLPYQYKHI